MDKKDSNGAASGAKARRVFVIAAIILGLVVLCTAIWIKRYVYASKFTPVRLSREEQAVLDAKLALLGDKETFPAGNPPVGGKPLSPEPYTEKGARREVRLSEREVNALLAGTPEAAERVAIDLSEGLVSVMLVLPIEEEVPVLGGKTLRIHLGVVINYEGNRPEIALKGVSLGGIPLPAAWLGNLKNVNLLEEFGTEDGFWKTFSAGVERIRVRQGSLEITLKE